MPPKDLTKLTVVQLKEKLKAKGLPVSGTKALLIERLGKGATKTKTKSNPEQTIPELKAILRAAGEKVGGNKAELVARVASLSKEKVTKVVSPKVTKVESPDTVLIRQKIEEQIDLALTNGRRDAKLTAFTPEEISKFIELNSDIIDSIIDYINGSGLLNTIILEDSWWALIYERFPDRFYSLSKRNLLKGKDQNGKTKSKTAEPTMAELKAKLKAAGEKVGGNKAELVARVASLSKTSKTTKPKTSKTTKPKTSKSDRTIEELRNIPIRQMNMAELRKYAKSLGIYTEGQTRGDITFFIQRAGW
jgi:hypothetical protein